MSSELFKSELRSPQEILQAIEQKIMTRPEIIKAIERYGDRRAMEAREEVAKQLGVPLKQEIDESLSRVTKMIDELFEKTILAMNDIKKGTSKK